MPTARLSSKGQLVLPKPVRDALGLEPGDELRVEVEDGSIRIVPRRKRRLEEVLARLPGHEPLDEAVLTRALKAYSGTGLDFPDVFLLAWAEEYGGQVVGFDGGLRKAGTSVIDPAAGEP